MTTLRVNWLHVWTVAVAVATFFAMLGYWVAR